MLRKMLGWGGRMLTVLALAHMLDATLIRYSNSSAPLTRAPPCLFGAFEMASDVCGPFAFPNITIKSSNVMFPV